MSQNPESNGNRNRNRRRRRGGRGGPGGGDAPSGGSRPAFKTIDERSGLQKLVNKLSLGILCKPKTSSRSGGGQAPKTNVTIVGSGGGSSSQPRPPRQDGGQPRPPREPKPQREYVPAVPADVSTERLYVGNLNYDATESDLFELFQGVGTVRNAEVVVHSRTQRSKGFAFVTMGTVEEARRAVQELTNKEFMGRPLQISGAKPGNRGDREGGSSSGGDSARRDESVIDAAEEEAAKIAA